MNYCDNSTFDTMTERSPNGVTHMDRLSMKKFKFQTSVDVFMQCKIRACAQQPCGVCTGNNPPRSLSNVDLSPAEGEMYAPPTQVKVGMNDKNALVFPDTVNTGVMASAPAVSPTASSSLGATAKPIEIHSQLTLASITPSWAMENKPALEATLRSTLGLRSDEVLVITSISKATRRALQAGSGSTGVRVDFTVGVSDAVRALAQKQSLINLASGSSTLVQQFSAKLDEELTKRGKQPIQLSPSALSFTKPEQQEYTVWSKSNNNYPAASAQQTNSLPSSNINQETSQTRTSGDDEISPLLYIMLGAFALAGLGFFAYKAGQGTKNTPASSAQQPETQHQSGDMYASKVAALDGDWAGQAAQEEW
jgi:hypothetical protein